MRIVKCKVCGGTVDTLGGHYIKCDYCGQVYGLSGDYMSAEDVYNDAIEMQKKDTVSDNENARMLLEGISGYKDSDERALNSYLNIENIKIAAEEKKLKEERELELERKYQKEKRIRDEKTKKITIGLLLLGIFIVVIALMINQKRTEVLNQKYTDAVQLYDSGEYIEAENLFKDIIEYKDSEKYIQQIANKMSDMQSVYENAVAMYEEENYIESIYEFEEIVGYLNSADYVELCANKLYEQAKDEKEKNEYDKAKELLSYIPENSSLYNEAIELTELIDEIILKNQYDIAVSLYNSNEFLNSQSIFMKISDYEDSNTYLDLIGNVLYEKAKEFLDIADYDSFAEIIAYIDSEDEWAKCTDALELKNTAYNQYVDDIRNEAKNILRNQGYKAFTDYINGSENGLFSQSDIKKVIEEFEPTQLVSLETYDSGSNVRCGYEYEYMSDWVDKTMKFTDNWGETYDSGIYWKYGMGQKLYVEYDMREYSLFTASIICNNIYKADGRGGYVKIYGDDVLLYSSDLVAKGYETTDITLDISNVTILKIEFVGGYGRVDNASQPSVVNPMVFK